MSAHEDLIDIIKSDKLTEKIVLGNFCAETEFIEFYALRGYDCTESNPLKVMLLQYTDYRVDIVNNELPDDDEAKTKVIFHGPDFDHAQNAFFNGAQGIAANWVQKVQAEGLKQ